MVCLSIIIHNWFGYVTKNWPPCSVAFLQLLGSYRNVWSYKHFAQTKQNVTVIFNFLNTVYDNCSWNVLYSPCLWHYLLMRFTHHSNRLYWHGELFLNVQCNMASKSLKEILCTTLYFKSTFYVCACRYIYFWMNRWVYDGPVCRITFDLCLFFLSLVGPEPASGGPGSPGCHHPQTDWPHPGGWPEWFTGCAAGTESTGMHLSVLSLGFLKIEDNLGMWLIKEQPFIILEYNFGQAWNI